MADHNKLQHFAAPLWFGVSISRSCACTTLLQHACPSVPFPFLSQCLSFGPKFLEPWGRKWRFSLGLLYGIAKSPIPRRVRLLMVVGKPVKVEKTARSDPNFQAVVDSTHQAYMDALQALYDKHKGLYGWEDHPLVMH